jgi:hypothetical protein
LFAVSATIAAVMIRSSACMLPGRVMDVSAVGEELPDAEPMNEIATLGPSQNSSSSQ